MTDKKGSHRLEPGSSNSDMDCIAYQYIDAAFGGVANRNNIIKADSLIGYAKRWKTQKGGDFIDCYRTYFQYPKEILDHVTNTGSVRGFNGPCWAKVFPLDIDSENLEESQQKAKAILMRLRDEFEVDPKSLRVYFSGFKGFHMEMPSKLFGGFIPSPKLHEEFKALAKLISEDVDLTIYDKVRLWRLPNTINSKSGLYKIPLTADELFNLTIDEIKEMAKSPRKGIFFDPNMNISEPLKKLYEQARQSILKSNERSKEEKKYERLININSKVSEGERNGTLTSYAGKLRSWNIPQGEAEIILRAMNQTHCLPPLDDREVENIIRSVYKYETSQFEFKILSWTQLIGTEEPELDFLIQDILPMGNLIILAGKPKLGKSLLALLFAISVGLGKQLWDKKVNQGGVLFISTEDGEVRLKKRIWKMVEDPDKHNPSCYFYVNNCVVTDKKVMDALRVKIAELKPKLVILDPLINLFKGKELNSGEDMNQVLRPLQELAKESGVCVLVIHHARKSAGDDPIDVIQGSITISGVADGLLILKNFKRGEKKKATLEVILKDAEVPKTVVLRLDDNLRWDIEGDLENVVERDIEDEVMRALCDESGLTIQSLIQITGYEYKSLYRCLLNMEGDTKVRVEKKGKSHTKFYFLENEWKTKMESEKSDLNSCNHSETGGNNSSFSRFPHLESEDESWKTKVSEGSFSKNDTHGKVENETSSEKARNTEPSFSKSDTPEKMENEIYIPEYLR